jgi:hypothetical protein
MTIKKSICGFFTLVLLLTTLAAGIAGCASSTPEAIKMVPPRANFVAEVQLNKLLTDTDLTDAYDSNQEGSIEEALDDIEAESGLDLREFSRALFFGDLESTSFDGNPEYMAFIVQGNFKESEFIQNIEDKTDEQMTTSDYKGHKLYTNDAEDFTIAFLSNKMFVFGMKQAVEDTIDVSKGDKKPLSGLVMDAYNRLGDAMITCAMVLPDEARESLREDDSSSSPMSTKVFADMDVVAFAFDKKSDNLAIKINLHFTGTQSVTDAKDTISGLISLLKGTMQVDEVKDLMDKIEVTASAQWLNVSLDTTISELESLSQSFPME